MKRPLFKRFQGDERGATLVFVAVSMPFLLSLLIGSVYVGIIHVQAGQCQNAADSAALAAASALSDGLDHTATGTEYAALNGAAVESIEILRLDLGEGAGSLRIVCRIAVDGLGPFPPVIVYRFAKAGFQTSDEGQVNFSLIS